MAAKSCCCGPSADLLYACSGAANTGYLADRVARSMASNGSGKMTCLAAVGAELSGFVESARGAERNIVIDGCPVACGAAVFSRLGLAFEHAVMTDHGVEKGKTEITDRVVSEVTAAVQAQTCCG